MAKKRPVSWLERFIIMGFPVDKIDYGANSEKELTQMIGNAMECGCLAAATLAGLSVVDFSKLGGK